MYEILTSIFLGIIQGATEFIPISSSGHLILARDLLGIEATGTLGYDAVLQLATALAVFVYFRKDLMELLRSALLMVQGREVERSQRVLIWALVLGTIPAAFLGVLLQDYMETTFRSAGFVAITLLLGSILFYVAERVAKQDSFLTVRKGVGVGFFQALALFPGASRSGMTISGGLILGLTREQAARFSFLLSFPIIVGSGLVKLFGLGGQAVVISMELLISAIVAFTVGLWAIAFLLRYLRNHTLYIFVWYRVVLAIVVYIVVM